MLAASEQFLAREKSSAAVAAMGSLEERDPLRFDQEDGSKEADASSECSTSTTPTGGSIIHKVCKTDNLAGLAVKYGVTVFDIKAVNGLHSDYAMFGREILMIPVKKEGMSDSVDRATMVRFIGGLGDRSLVQGIGSSRAKLDPQSMLLNLRPPESRPVQEIELHEHVGYAGSQSGSEQNIFTDRIRRRKREEEVDETSRFGRAISWGNHNIIGSGRPPTAPTRASDPSSVTSKEKYSLMAGVIKSIIPGYMIEKVKTIANSGALDGIGMAVPMHDSFNWPESSLSPAARSLSETAGTQQRTAVPPKNCPKTE